MSKQTDIKPTKHMPSAEFLSAYRVLTTSTPPAQITTYISELGSNIGFPNLNVATHYYGEPLIWDKNNEIPHLHLKHWVDYTPPCTRFVVFDPMRDTDRPHEAITPFKMRKKPLTTPPVTPFVFTPTAPNGTFLTYVAVNSQIYCCASKAEAAAMLGIPVHKLSSKQRRRVPTRLFGSALVRIVPEQEPNAYFYPLPDEQNLTSIPTTPSLLSNIPTSLQRPFALPEGTHRNKTLLILQCRYKQEAVNIGIQNIKDLAALMGCSRQTAAFRIMQTEFNPAFAIQIENNPNKNHQALLPAGTDVRILSTAINKRVFDTLYPKVHFWYLPEALKTYAGN